MKKTIYRGKVHCINDGKLNYAFYGNEWDNKEKAIEETKTNAKELLKKGYKINYAEIEIIGSQIIKL